MIFDLCVDFVSYIENILVRFELSKDVMRVLRLDRI